MSMNERGETPAAAPARSAARTARERARAEITSEILETGRRHLATDGAAGLSLRAIARDLGMVSSAVYRYVASRDDLLTKLIIDAYDSLGAAAEISEAQVDRDDLTGRWQSICLTVRDWAIANPNEYALIYGSPVPGYVAPTETVGPASRVANLFVQVLIDAVAVDRIALPPASTTGEVPRWQVALGPIRAAIPADVPTDVILAALMAWSGLFGAISLELFGQFHNVVSDDPADRNAFFGECVTRWAAQVGLEEAQR